MDWLRRSFPKLFGITIETDFGPVTESARKQAALNMKADPELKLRVENLMIQKYNGDAKAAMIECARRYPEAYRD